MRIFMRGGILWSGGKDSVLALHRARKSGIDVRYAFVFYYREMTFPPLPETIIAQCEALSLTPIILETDMVTVNNVINRSIIEHDLKLDCLVYGEGQIAGDIRWFNGLCKSLNIKPVLPNFKVSVLESMQYLFDNKFKFIITRHNHQFTDPEYQFKAIEYTPELFQYVIDTHRNLGAAPFGPASSCQTFVYDGPDFKYPIEVFVENKLRGRVRLLSASTHSEVPQRILPTAQFVSHLYNADTHIDPIS